MSMLKISKHSDVPAALDLVREVLNKEMKLAVHGDTNTAIMGKEKLMPRYGRLKNTTWTSLRSLSSCLTRFFGH